MRGYIVIPVAALVFLAALAALFLAAAIWMRHREGRTLKRLNRMLEQAVDGACRESDFDESLLSATETKFAHYLAANAVSTQNLQWEKDKIKTLIADISHQTKTPVANILLYTQLLEEQELSSECREYVTSLKNQVEKLRNLIDALIKTSRLETGILTLHPKKGGLFHILEGVVRQFALKAAAKQITLTLEQTDAEGTFDPKWTAEAICNLLDNAVKYTPSGGAVTVQAVSYELFCCINVIDTGPGIPEAEQAKIFQRFYRSPAAHETEGVGIGLYLARQIANGQGGYIKVRSCHGKGAQFSMFIPRS